MSEHILQIIHGGRHVPLISMLQQKPRDELWVVSESFAIDPLGRAAIWSDLFISIQVTCKVRKKKEQRGKMLKYFSHQLATRKLTLLDRLSFPQNDAYFTLQGRESARICETTNWIFWQTNLWGRKSCILEWHRWIQHGNIWSSQKSRERSEENHKKEIRYKWE